MFQSGNAYIDECEGQLGIVFGRVGYDARFRLLLDDFKRNFPFRNWEGNKWIIPLSQRNALIDFCHQRGLRVIYRKV